MFRSIDGKSLLIGGLLVAVVVCAMGDAPIMDPQYHGRFSMTAKDTSGGDVYILDTATGQVWSRDHMYFNVFCAPKLEGYAPIEEPMPHPEPNWPPEP